MPRTGQFNGGRGGRYSEEKYRHQEEAEAKEARRTNAWLRELLTSSSEGEKEPEEKRARADGEGCLRYKESRRLLAEADPTGWGEMAKLSAESSPTKEGESEEAERLMEEAEYEKGGLVTDKMIEALVLLEERTRAIGVRLERIEARLKELDVEEKKEKKLEEANLREARALPRGYKCKMGGDPCIRNPRRPNVGGRQKGRRAKSGGEISIWRFARFTGGRNPRQRGEAAENGRN